MLRRPGRGLLSGAVDRRARPDRAAGRAGPGGGRLDETIAQLAILGADQVTSDWETLVRAIGGGELEAKDLD